MKRAAIYVRVSTNRQAERDLSIPDQMAQCRTWCEQRGIEVVEVFSEPGASALDEDRPVFQEMIYKAKRPDKPFDGVVVHSLSRFSRDTLHSELYIRELNKAGVELVSITQDVGQDSTGELVRKMLHVFDEHQSRETAKHVSRAMCENARQGFWNGSTPPYGYKLEVKERRGNKDKKVLVPNETEAAVVRMIFDLASGASGRPMGVKNIAVHLNDRGIRRKGHRWSTGSVHVILSTTTYRGLHHFNKRDSRKGIPRPPSQWIAMEVPALVDERTFDVVQGLLQSRDPKRMPPRVANGPTLLAGIASCGNCGAALIQNTGKSGAYRYYCCSKRLKEGIHDCKGLRMRMDALDGMVIGEVAKVLLEPQHLTELLEGYMRTSAERSEAAHAQLAKVRHAHKEAEAAIARLLGLVEQGIMDAGDPALRDRLTGLRLQRDELAREVSEQQKRLADGTPQLTPAKIKSVGNLLRDKLFEGPPELRQAYARLLLSEVAVTSSEIKITGSKSVLARCASTELDEVAPVVLSFVQKWRTRQDSNL
jgi:site-specific DNA recombinase